MKAFELLQHCLHIFYSCSVSGRKSRNVMPIAAINISGTYRAISMLSVVCLLTGCTAAAIDYEQLDQTPVYGPQNKVSIFIRGLDDAVFTDLVELMLNDPVCEKFRVVERSFEYGEIACDTPDGAGIVANAFQSSAQQLSVDLTVSHAGDHVMMKLITQ